MGSKTSTRCNGRPIRQSQLSAKVDSRAVVLKRTRLKEDGGIGRVCFVPAPPRNRINSAARAHYDAGSALLRRTSTYDAAIAAFERSVAADPDSAQAYAGLAEAQWAKQSLTAITKNNEWLDRATQNRASGSA